MALMVTNTAIVQAATTDSISATTTDMSNTDNSSSNSANADNAIKISLANIKDIILENNLSAKMLDNTRDNAKLDYDNAKNTKDSKESAYNTAKNEEAAYEKDPVKNPAPSVSVSSAEGDLNDAKDALDSARYDLRTANIKYEQNLESLIKQAQTDYISYILSDLPSKDYNTANVQALKNASDAAKIQYDMGFLSKNDYTTAQLNYTKALNASNTSNDAEENDKAKLLYDLGLSSGENVVFDTNLEQDLKNVSTINYDNDLTQMFNNSLTLQTDNINIEEASDNKDNYEDDNDDDSDNYDNDDEQYDNKLKTAQLQLVLDKNNAEKDFKTKYDALMNSYATMKSSSDSLDQQKNNYNAAQVQLDYGFVSQQDVDEANVKSLQESQSFQSDKSKFYQDYLSYIEAKEGY
jgi:hypothetical protein